MVDATNKRTAEERDEDATLTVDESAEQTADESAEQTKSTDQSDQPSALETVLEQELNSELLQPVQKRAKIETSTDGHVTPRPATSIQFSRFASPHEFHHVLNDWAMQSSFAFNTGKERVSDKSIAITYACCRTNQGKSCSFEVRGKKRKDEDFWTLHKMDVRGTGHNHSTGEDVVLSKDQQILVDLAERQRLCDIPSFYHPSLPPRFVAYSSSDTLYSGLNDWARHQDFFFRLGTNWATKSGNENQTYYCGISGCSYAVTGIRLAGQQSWSIRTYNARHVEHNHEGASAKNKEQISSVSLPPVADKYPSFPALHEALNGWSTTKNFAFKTGTSSTGHTNGLVSKYMVCCMVASDTGDPCEYSVIVKEAKDGMWSVSQAMKARKDHNHSLEGELTHQQQSLLDAAETRRIIQMPDYAPEHLPSRTVTFPDRQKLFLHLEKFAKQRNFKFAIKRSKKEKNGRVLVNYECAKNRKQQTKCPYHVYARESKDGLWSVSYPYNLKNEHNHE